MNGKRYERPDFELVEKKENYEVRCYPACKLAAVTSQGNDFEDSRISNFHKLLDYIRGDNVRNEKIPMMVPIMTNIQFDQGGGMNGGGCGFGGGGMMGGGGFGGGGMMGGGGFGGDDMGDGLEGLEDPFVKQEYSMGFFVPKSHDEDPPEGLITELEIVDFGPGIIYAVSFSGFADKNTVFRLQRKFKDDLEADGVDFDPSTFFTAVFNNPWTMTDRHNELYYMAMKKDDADDETPSGARQTSDDPPSKKKKDDSPADADNSSSPNSPADNSLPTDNAFSDNSSSDGNSSDKS